MLFSDAYLEHVGTASHLYRRSRVDAGGPCPEAPHHRLHTLAPRALPEREKRLMISKKAANLNCIFSIFPFGIEFI
jgi:hypothetical protein